MGSLVVAQAQGSGLFNLLFFVGIIVLFYFLLIRPQRVRQRRHQELVASLHVGDRIQTIGGILGVIRKMDDESVVIEVEDGGRLRIARRAVAGKQGQKQ